VAFVLFLCSTVDKLKQDENFVRGMGQINWAVWSYGKNGRTKRTKTL